MDVSTVSEGSKIAAHSWPHRLRLALGVLLIWALLQFLLNATLMAPGLARPATLAASNHALLAGLGLGMILLAGSIVAARVAGPAYPQRGLLVAALALALWAVPAGTMTDWLMLNNPQIGPPTARAYWPLAGEYLWLLALMLAVAVLTEISVPIAELNRAVVIDQCRRTVGLHLGRTARKNGLLALLLGVLITGVLMLILTGPAAAGQTLRGQVYFAVAVSSACGAFVAYRVVRVTDPIWYWPAPILAGLLGVLLAAARPALMLPAAYTHLNSIPAWGLARALPIEMVGVGVAASLWALRACQRSARGRQTST
jgi:hypothetical protein